MVNKKRGIALLEIILIIPLLFSFLGAIVNIGFILDSKSALTYDLRNGAQYIYSNIYSTTQSQSTTFTNAVSIIEGSSQTKATASYPSVTYSCSNSSIIYQSLPTCSSGNYSIENIELQDTTPVSVFLPNLFGYLFPANISEKYNFAVATNSAYPLKTDSHDR